MLEHVKLSDSEDVSLPEQEKEVEKPNNDFRIPPDGGFQVI